MGIFDGLDLTNALTVEQAKAILEKKGVTDEDVATAHAEMQSALAANAAMGSWLKGLVDVAEILASIGLKVIVP